MPNSVESEAKRVVSFGREKAANIMEVACNMLDGDSWCIDCAVAKPKPEPWISTRTIAIGALLVGLFLPPLIALDEIIGTASAWRGPAVGFHEVSLLTPVLRLGEPMIIKTKSQYLRLCSWQWTLEWRRTDGKPIAIQQHFGSAHVIGVTAEHDIALELPHGILPGDYIYHESATAQCGSGGDIAQIIDPDMPFTVTE